MASLAVKSLKKQVNRVIIAQCVAVVVVSVVFLFLLGGEKSAVAVIVGGLVYVTPCYLYANRLFSNVSAQAIKRIIITFYLGEIGKLVVSVGLFIGLYHVYQFPIMPYFLGYLVAAIAFCVAPIWLINSSQA